MNSILQIRFCRAFLTALIAPACLESSPAETFQRVAQAPFGTAEDGSEMKLITLRNLKGMSAQINKSRVLESLWGRQLFG